jgi:hypothetical protein
MLAIFLIVFGGLLSALIYFIHPYLSINRPNREGILVVEGWLPRYALVEALALFSSGNYNLMITTGGPIEEDTVCSKFGNYAEMAKSIMLDLEPGQDRIVAVPASIATVNRTFASAVALKNWLDRENLKIGKLDIVSLGAHARRSSILFDRALGENISVGIISLQNREYDPAEWWKYSCGIKIVIEEALAYLYTQWSF